MNKEISNVVELSDSYRETGKERISIREKVGKEILIMDIEKRESKKEGKYLVITDIEGNEYYSFSKIMLEQEGNIDELMGTDNAVRVRIEVDVEDNEYFVVKDTTNYVKKIDDTTDKIMWKVFKRYDLVYMLEDEIDRLVGMHKGDCTDEEMESKEDKIERLCKTKERLEKEIKKLKDSMWKSR